MAYDYLNSVTQKYIQFVTTAVVVTVPGLNFGKLMIFVAYTDQATYFVSDPGTGTVTEVTASNYAQVTKGLLKTWLDGFFLSKSVAYVELVTVAATAGIFTTSDLVTQLAAFGERAYFKTAIGSSAAKNIDNNVSLARLCVNDPLSQFIYGTSDATILSAGANNEAFQFIGSKLTGLSGTTNATITLTSVTGGTPNQGWIGATIQGVNITPGTTITAVSGTTLTLSQAASGSGTQAFSLVFQYDVPIAYHPSATLNAALVQLGSALAALNSTGTYVGNKLDFSSISGFSASGTAGANLTPTQAANCYAAGVAFYTSLGDGSGNVMLEGGAAGIGWTTPLSKNIGAYWVINYVDTVSAQLTTSYLAQAGRFKNNDTYQGVLAILAGQLKLFSDLGRLSTVKITAPPYTQLPAAAGGVITVPQAWSALYNDNLRSVTVYGTLYIAS
jgi:hypothetical protein